jgi:hypothetical protein
LTDQPSLEGSIGPIGPLGPTGLNGASEWSDIYNKLIWLATSQGSVNLSNFNKDLTATSVEWSDVLNKPSIRELKGLEGPQGPPGLNGASE